MTAMGIFKVAGSIWTRYLKVLNRRGKESYDGSLKI
jgi:hypothetical protein